MRAHDWTQTPKDWCTGLSYWRDSRIFWTGNVAIQDVKRTKGQSRKELEDIHLPLSDGVIRIIHWLRASQSTTDSRRLPSPSTGHITYFPNLGHHSEVLACNGAYGSLPSPEAMPLY